VKYTRLARGGRFCRECASSTAVRESLTVDLTVRDSLTAIRQTQGPGRAVSAVVVHTLHIGQFGEGNAEEGQLGPDLAGAGVVEVGENAHG
jgi:hypothetical protein